MAPYGNLEAEHAVAPKVLFSTVDDSIWQEPIDSLMGVVSVIAERIES